MFCSRCAGTGEIVGNGMILIECIKCNGTGDYEKYPEEKPPIDKRSSAYKSAIQEIMDLHPSITKKEAEKLFKENYDKY